MLLKDTDEHQLTAVVYKVGRRVLQMLEGSLLPVSSVSVAHIR